MTFFVLFIFNAIFEIVMHLGVSLILEKKESVIDMAPSLPVFVQLRYN